MKKSRALFLVFVCTLCISAGQLFLKMGAEAGYLDIRLYLGFFFYGCGAVLLVVSLKKANLSYIYPLLGLTYIWVSLLSVYFLSERITVYNWIGVALILSGSSLIASGDKDG